MSEGETLEQIRRLLMGSESGPTFGEVWGRYFREHARGLDTARDVERMGRLLCKAWGERPALKLSPADGEDYRDARRATHTRRGSPPAHQTIDLELGRARAAMNWAVRERIVSHNPLAGVRLERPDNVRRSHLRTEEELERLLEHADRTMRALILAQIDCGFRRMEVFALEWSQIILVPHRDALRPMVQLWKTKNGKPRRCALSTRTYEAIWALPRYGRYVFVGREPGRYRGDEGASEAPPRPGTYLSPDATLRKFKRLVTRAGLEGVNGESIVFHTLRHSFAYLLRVRDGVSERSIMKQGGWLTRSAFDRYGIGGEEELAEMYEAVDASIAAARTKPPR
jgi:integrase